MQMTQERSEKRMGRPLKAPTPGQRVSLGLKVTAEVKQRIDEEARRSGRTQSQQAELMIERSFAEERALGGPALRRLAFEMASAYARAGQFSGAGKPDWMQDPDCHIAGIVGVFQALLIGLSDQHAKLVVEALRGTVLTRIANEGEKK